MESQHPHFRNSSPLSWTRKSAEWRLRLKDELHHLGSKFIYLFRGIALEFSQPLADCLTQLHSETCEILAQCETVPDLSFDLARIREGHWESNLPPRAPFCAPGSPFCAPGSPFCAPGSPSINVGASFCALGSTFCAPHQNLKFKTKAIPHIKSFFNKMLKAYESDNDVVMYKGIYLIAFKIKDYIRN